MKREQLYELYRLNKKLSKDVANMIDYLDSECFDNIDDLSKIITYLIKIDNELRYFEYKEIENEK